MAALISGKLSDRGIDAILVGGACVSIYTENKYQSFDLDFVSHVLIGISIFYINNEMKGTMKGG